MTTQDPTAERLFSPLSATPGEGARVKVFVDYWNFQLSLNEKEASERGIREYRFLVNWATLGHWLAAKACATSGISYHVFAGVSIYTSYDPRTSEGSKYRRWVMTFLDRQTGVTAHCRERKPRPAPTCSKCHSRIVRCPHCEETLGGSEEKGVDTLIATEMIGIAWEDGYDLAVLATSDRDLIPAVSAVRKKGRRVVQAGFPPQSAELAEACSSSFDVYPHRDEICRE